MDSERHINKWQLIAIGTIIGLMLFDATMTLGVIPVYVVRLGADPATTGLYLAFNFFCVTIGNVAGGWLTDRIGQRKRVTLISLLIWIPIPLLMTQATTVAGVILTSGLMWLPGGVAIAALNGIMGLSAGESERGRVFGLIGFLSGIGGVIAGVVGGPIVAQWEFKGLFVIMAIMVVVMFVIAIFVRDVANAPTTTRGKSGAAPTIGAGIGMLVYMLLMANLIGRLGVSASDLGRPLVMLKLGLDTTAVSNAIAVSNAVVLPLPLIMGWLSDRVGRKGLIILCFGLGAAGVLMLSGASQPWHFWLSAALVAMVNASGGVGQAYIADLSDPKMIGQALSLYNSSNFISGMIGLGGAGYVMQAVGINSSLILGACLLGIGILILWRIRTAAPKVAVEIVEAAV